MKIRERFIGQNPNVQILSNNGAPTAIPQPWQPILGDSDMIVAIPDMHMFIRNSPIDNFHWVARTMIDFLDFVDRRKHELEDEDKMLRVYQLGDLYELRFPGRNGNVTATEIAMSDRDYSVILNQLESLSLVTLYGNHDFENRHYVGYNFAQRDGSIYLEHGFAPDTAEANPTLPGWNLAMLGLMTARSLNEHVVQLAIDLNLIPQDRTYSMGVRSAEQELIGIVPDSDYRQEYGHIKDYYCGRLRTGPQNERCRIAIVGHTHAPHFDDTVDGGNYFYIDAGGWTEGRSTFVVATNEEIALCHYRRV